MKKCSRCKKSQSLSNFVKNKRAKDGYNWQCKSCVNEYRNNNKDKIKKQRQEHYQQNKKAILKSKKIYADQHKEEKAAYDKIYRLKNKSKIAKQKKEWQVNNKNNILLKIKRNLRRRTHHVLKGANKSASTMTLIGCSIEFFLEYIENQFVDGMSWDNYGIDGWHLDHIVPCYKFDLTNPEEQKRCFHYSNQRPLWAKDNLSRPRD